MTTLQDLHMYVVMYCSLAKSGRLALGASFRDVTNCSQLCKKLICMAMVSPALQSGTAAVTCKTCLYAQDLT